MYKLDLRQQILYGHQSMYDYYMPVLLKPVKSRR